MHEFEILSLCIYSVVLPRITFLGPSAKLWKGTVGIVLSVCVHSTVCMEQLSSNWRDFHEIWYL